MSVTLVVPTLGRPSLAALLESLGASEGPAPDELLLIDDRPRGDASLLPAGTDPSTLSRCPVRVLHSGGRGPAAARNVGIRASRSRWVAFLDDDVVVTPTWLADLHRDLSEAAGPVGGVQGQVTVPLPAGRRPTDWERGTAGLASARWITADMAYRSDVLAATGGFDERFPRAFREDADLALRVQDAGFELRRGRRGIVHPVRPAAWSASIRQQRGNADDPLMRRLHGSRWARRAGAPPGRRPRHAAVTAAAAGGVLAAATGRRRPAAAALLAWAAGTAEFAWGRIAPGPRDAREVGTMLATSILIPPAAVGHWLAGVVRHRGASAWPVPS